MVKISKTKHITKRGVVKRNPQKKLISEEIKLTKQYIKGTFKENYRTYNVLKKFFQQEINKLPFEKWEFSSYKECYNKVATIFYNNGVISRDCNIILNFKNKEHHSLNEIWAWEGRKNYYYINALPTQEVHIVCVNRRYFLKYRVLNLNKLW